jgi:hypothetical protein
VRSKASAFGELGCSIAMNPDDQGKARVAALVQRLRELGWAEGRNIRIDVRWLGGDTGRAKAYAAELVRLSPDVLIANGPTVLDLQRAQSRLSSFKCQLRSSSVLFRPSRGQAA